MNIFLQCIFSQGFCPLTHANLSQFPLPPPPPPPVPPSLLACSHPLSFPVAPSRPLFSQLGPPTSSASAKPLLSLSNYFFPILHPLLSLFPSSSLQVVTPFFCKFPLPSLPSMFPSSSLTVPTTFSPSSHLSPSLLLPMHLHVPSPSSFPLYYCVPHPLSSPLSFTLVTAFFPSLLTKYLTSFYLHPQEPLFLLFHWA